MKDKLLHEFEMIFQVENANIYFAPGRVNLIGEHIDYNGGLVMPCAITQGTYLAINRNRHNVLNFRSTNFEEHAEVPLKDGYQKSGSEWFNYPIGVIDQFLQKGIKISGLDMLFEGNIPIGSGLSSSASIEIVTAYALNELFNCGFSKLELVKMCKSVENDFIGLNSGIMDQFSVAFGEKDRALLLNCDTLDYDTIPCNLGDYVLAIINTNKLRRLAESKYNERFNECRTALGLLQKELQIANLCDIDFETYQSYKHLITDVVIDKRATHVIQENDRVKQAAKALSSGDLLAFGKLMYASHRSLKELYEVSGKELDTVVEYSQTDANVIGARMTGAGFGGCAIALVKQSGFEDFSDRLTEYYTDKVGYAPSVYHSSIGDGVKKLG